MTRQSLILPDGQIRRDDEALELAASALRADNDVPALVEDIGDRTVAPGSFGLLLPARLRSIGADVLVKEHALDGPWLVDWMRPGIAALATPDAERLAARFADDRTWVCTVCDPTEPDQEWAP